MRSASHHFTSFGDVSHRPDHRGNERVVEPVSDRRRYRKLGPPSPGPIDVSGIPAPRPRAGLNTFNELCLRNPSPKASSGLPFDSTRILWIFF